MVEEAIPGHMGGGPVRQLKGWRSNHLPPEGGPIGWCTAQALRCIYRMDELTREVTSQGRTRTLAPFAAPLEDPHSHPCRGSSSRTTCSRCLEAVRV